MDDGTSLYVDPGSNAVSQTLTIADDDALSTIEFSSSFSYFDENDAVLTDPFDIPLTLSSATEKDLYIKYSVLGSGNGGTATKNFDYDFGTPTLNGVGDSIVTILGGSGITTTSIPLTIVDDTFDEDDDQTVIVSISLANTYTESESDEYDNFNTEAGAEASLGTTSAYTFTIQDDDPEPYIKFETDLSGNEGSSTGYTELSVTASLVDAAGATIVSERDISVSYVVDTDQTFGETEYTTASEDTDLGAENHYDDDFFMASGFYIFSGRDYTGGILTEGENEYSNSLYIYKDGLYELDETVNIEFTSFTNAQSSPVTIGDHSYVYTILNDDTEPSVDWTLTTVSGEEGDPENAGGDYINTDATVTMSIVSGTDIIVEYSEGTGDNLGTATGGGMDYTLEADDPVIGVKTVTIPASTSSSENLIASIPITLHDDESVEGPETINFHIDGWRDTGYDGEVSNGGDDNEYSSSGQWVNFTIIDNDNPPTDFNVGGVVTTATTTDLTLDPVVEDHWDPVTENYWNSYNDGMIVRVPLDPGDDDDDGVKNLVDGQAKIIVRVRNDDGTFGDYTDLTGLTTITAADYTVEPIDSNDLSVTKDELTGLGEAIYADGNILDISAIIYDKNGNSTTGEPSVNTITIDTEAPVMGGHTVEDIVANGGTVIPTYWNNTNTRLSVDIAIGGTDLTMGGGSSLLLAGIGPDNTIAAYESLGEPLPILSSSLGDTIKHSPAVSDIEAMTEYGDDRIINIKAELVDAAGNKTTIAVSDIQTLIDVSNPSITSVTSTTNGLQGVGDIVDITINFSESITLTEDVVNINSRNFSRSILNFDN